MNVVLGGGDPRLEGSGFGQTEWNWDLLSEWIMPSEESFLEIQRIMESPAIKRLFQEDEDRFIDRKEIAMMPCTAVCNTAPRFIPNALYSTRLRVSRPGRDSSRHCLSLSSNNKFIEE